MFFRSRQNGQNVWKVWKGSKKKRPPSGCKVKVKLYKHLLSVIECECADGLSDAVLTIRIAPLEKRGRQWRWRAAGAECLALKVCQTPWESRTSCYLQAKRGDAGVTTGPSGGVLAAQGLSGASLKYRSRWSWQTGKISMRLSCWSHYFGFRRLCLDCWD